MNKTELSALIASLLDKNSLHALAAREKVAGLPLQFSEHLYEHYLSVPLAELLATQPEFPGGKGYLLSMRDGWSGFHCSEAASALLSWAKEHGSADAAVDWLTRFLKITSTDCLYIVTLWGVKTSERLALPNDFALVPFEQLPSSSTKESIANSAQQARSNPLVPLFFSEVPVAAVTKQTSVSPLLKPVSDADVTEPAKQKLLSQEADEIILPLACLGPCSPTEAVSWLHFLDPDVAHGVSYGGMFRKYIDLLPIMRLEQVDLTLLEPAKIIASYLATSGDLRGQLDVALSRLSRAVRSHLMADKALDLAIALETLLADSNPGEHTYKVALRAGLMTPGPLANKLSASALARALYGIRSSVAHSGHVKERVNVGAAGKRPSVDVIKDALELVAAITREMMTRGAPPDWANLEMSGGT